MERERERKRERKGVRQEEDGERGINDKGEGEGKGEKRHEVGGGWRKRDKGGVEVPLIFLFHGISTVSTTNNINQRNSYHTNTRSNLTMQKFSAYNLYKCFVINYTFYLLISYFFVFLFFPIIHFTFLQLIVIPTSNLIQGCLQVHTLHSTKEFYARTRIGIRPCDISHKNIPANC